MDKFTYYVDYILSITGYVIAWVNKTAKGIVRRLFGLNPEFVEETDQVSCERLRPLTGIVRITMLQEVNNNEQPNTKAEFVSNVRKEFEGTPAERFFKNNPKFIEELAEKAASLADDPNTPICNKDLLPKTAQVTMHQQVLYCGECDDDSQATRSDTVRVADASYVDDSTSMKREGRWDSQNQLINRIARVTTRILPEGEGVYMRYINQEIPSSDSLKFEDLLDVVRPLTWGGDTPIGTNLKSKILEPLVYSKLPNDLKRPLLVSIITDGMPEPEPRSTLVDAIAECGDKLEAAGLPRESKFHRHIFTFMPRLVSVFLF